MIIFQVLGEGMFGEVKLLVNKENGEACAMKEIDLDSHPEAEEVKGRPLPYSTPSFYIHSILPISTPPTLSSPTHSLLLHPLLPEPPLNLFLFTILHLVRFILPSWRKYSVNNIFISSLVYIFDHKEYNLGCEKRNLCTQAVEA